MLGNEFFPGCPPLDLSTPLSTAPARRAIHRADSEASCKTAFLANSGRKIGCRLTTCLFRCILGYVDADARQAWKLICRCLQQGRYRQTSHLRQRMAERGLFWPDVVAVLDDPRSVRGGGNDEIGRPKWLVEGIAVDGRSVELVCAIEIDGHGRTTVFITLYEVT